MAWEPPNPHPQQIRNLSRNEILGSRFGVLGAVPTTSLDSCSGQQDLGHGWWQVEWRSIDCKMMVDKLKDRYLGWLNDKLNDCYFFFARVDIDNSTGSLTPLIVEKRWYCWLLMPAHLMWDQSCCQRLIWSADKQLLRKQVPQRASVAQTQPGCHAWPWMDQVVLISSAPPYEEHWQTWRIIRRRHLTGPFIKVRERL